MPVAKTPLPVGTHICIIASPKQRFQTTVEKNNQGSLTELVRTLLTKENIEIDEGTILECARNFTILGGVIVVDFSQLSLVH